MQLSPRAGGLIAAVITIVVWTAFIVIARASALHTLTPPDMVWARLVGASLVLLPWCWWWGRRDGWVLKGQGSLAGFSPLPLRLTALVGLTGGLLYPLLAYAGFAYAPAAHASVLLPGSLPLWTALAAWVLVGERLSGRRVLALGLILSGDALVGSGSLAAAWQGGLVWRGDVLFMCAALCWAVYSVHMRQHGLHPIQATMAITVFAFLAYVPAYSVMALAGWIPTGLGVTPWPEVVFQMLFQGVGSVVISGITFAHMVRVFGPVRSTMMTAWVPGLSALGAWWWLDEPLQAGALAGLLLVTVGILWGVRASAGASIPPNELKK